MEEKLILNDGTEIENAHCFESDGRLFVYITGTSDMQRYFNLLIDPDNTAKIKAVQYGVETVHSGYVDLYSISKESGNINVVLRR